MAWVALADIIINTGIYRLIDFTNLVSAGNNGPRKKGTSYSIAKISG